MVAQITGGASVSVRDLLAVADETAQIMEYSSQLEAKSAELSQTAARLREVNQKLTQLSVQKDAFLSQISHELRTPMTSIRSFSEILMQADPVDDAARTRFSRIIHDESLRLTRLLDDLLGPERAGKRDGDAATAARRSWAMCWTGRSMPPARWRRAGASPSGGTARRSA
jgi:signal transduction histidine kinase